MKLNIGCGDVRLPGYINVDAYTEADIQADLLSLNFSEVEEVLCSHTLEHLPFYGAMKALGLFYRWLRQNGVLIIEVPDMRAISANVDDPWWLTYTYGCQAHPGEFHLCGFTPEILRAAVEKVGFHVKSQRSFLSDNPVRKDMPCTEIVAVKP